MPFAISLLALVAVVAILSMRVYKTDRRSIASSVISSVPHALVLAALSIMAFLGLLDEVPLSVSLPVAAAMCGMGALSAFRPSVAAYFEHTGQVLRTVGSLGLLVLASVAAWLAIETGTNTRMLDGTMHFWCVVIGFMTIWVMMAFGYLLTNRRSPIATLVAIACTLLGVAEYFVVTFKGMPILPSDLLALGTALLTETPPDPAIFSSADVWFSLGYLVLLSSCVCMVVQNLGQAHVPPAQASLLLSLESVFAVVSSVIFYHELVTPRIAVGFATIFVAVLVSELFVGRFKRGQTPFESSGRKHDSGV